MSIFLLFFVDAILELKKYIKAMESILSIIGLFILAALKLEQFVYGKSGKEQSTTGHIARRGLANIAGLIAFDHATVNSKSVVVRKKKKDAQK